MNSYFIFLFAVIFSITASAQQTTAPIVKEKWHWGNPNKQDTSAVMRRH